MKEKTINQGCTNCIYFVQHYVIIGSSFHTACCGHCTNKELTPKDRRSFPFTNGCELWAINKEKKAERTEIIENIIKEMEKHLNEIKQILKFDRQK